VSFRFFLDVRVDGHDALPNGCSMRFRAVGEPRAIRSVRYESEAGVDGVWSVEGETADGQRVPAHVVTVEDAVAGQAMLVYGGVHGLRLTSPNGGVTVAEPYLSLAPAAIIEVSQPTVRRPAR
jgi:hypothetical protein